jgi:prepilin-type N-terminal cleavage/methylation domain-containing protein
MSGRKLHGAMPFAGTKNINNATTRRGYLQHSLSKSPFVRQSFHRASQSKGFTLVELTVVIVIIGTLSFVITAYIMPAIEMAIEEAIQEGRLTPQTVDSVVVETQTTIEEAKRSGRCGDRTPNNCDDLEDALDNFQAAASAQSASVSVPGPLPIFGVASAFYFSRKLRKRIKASKSEKE